MIAKLYTQKHELVFGNRPEDIERYDEAISSSELYVPHHVLEFMYTVAELDSMNRYWLVSPDELIWMPQSVHKNNAILHKGDRLKYAARTGVKFTDEHRAKISKSNIGKKHSPLTEEQKDKIREAHTGKHWYNDGVNTFFTYECPEGCTVGRIKKKG